MVRAWTIQLSFFTGAVLLAAMPGCRAIDTREESGSPAGSPANERSSRRQMDAEQIEWAERQRELTQQARPDAYQQAQLASHASLDEESFRRGVIAQAAGNTTHLDYQEPVPNAAFQPQTQPHLTLETLENRALGNNPAIAEMEAEINAARGRWVQAGLGPNPYVGYSGQQLFSDGLAEQHGLIIGQQFLRGDKLAFRQAQVAQEIAIAEQRYASQQLRTITDVRQSFYRVLIAQMRVDVTGQLDQIAQEAVIVAEKMRNALEVSDLDVMRAKVERQEAALRLQNARSVHQAAWQGLAIVVGEPGLPLASLEGDIEAAIAPIQLDDAISRLMTESPELAEAMLEIERARARVNRETAEGVPDVDVETVVQSDNGTGSANANLLVKLPLPIRNWNQGAIREARAEWEAASRAAERLELALRKRMNEVYQTYVISRDQVEAYARPDGILIQGMESLELTGKAYEATEIDYLALLAAQVNFESTNLAYVEALDQMWESYSEIEGLLLKDGFETDGRSWESQ